MRRGRLPGAAAPDAHGPLGGRPVHGCFRRDLRVQVRGSKRARLMLADVIVGRRRVERLLNFPTARGQRGRPDAPERRRPAQADPPARPFPPARARGDGGRPQAHAGPRAAPLPLNTRSSSPHSGRRRSSGWSATMYSTSARLEATAKSAAVKLLAVQHAPRRSRHPPGRGSRRALRGPRAAAPSSTRNATSTVRRDHPRGGPRREQQAPSLPSGAAPGERVGVARAGGGDHAAEPTAGALVGPALGLERTRVVGHEPRLGHAARRVRAGSSRVPCARRPSSNFTAGTRSPAKPISRTITRCAPGREVHAPELDALVLEHQLAGPDRVGPRDRVERGRLIRALCLR